MTTTADFFTTITVTNEHDIQVPRYTNPRAVIDLDTYRRYTTNSGEVDVAVEGDKTNHDPADPHAGVTPEGVERIFDGLIPNVHMDDDPASILAAAESVLASQGFNLADAGWARVGNVFTADLTPVATTADHLNALGGVDYNPAIFTATYDGHTWHARKMGDYIHLARTCTGCWATGPGYGGMWNPRKHHTETSVTVQKVAEYDDRTARLRAIGEDEIADERDANAFRILKVVS